jgi:hypothetical protein
MHCKIKEIDGQRLKYLALTWSKYHLFKNTVDTNT